MKGAEEGRASMRTIGNFVMQAAAQGDTAGMLEHLVVYMAVVRAAKRQAEKASA